MNTPTGRLVLVGSAVALTVWGAVFSIYGAYRERTHRERLTARAETTARTLAAVMAAAADSGTESLEGALVAAVEEDLIVAAAVLGRDGRPRVVSPGFELGAEPETGAGCAVCHRAGQSAPLARSARSAGELHLFLEGALGGDHLYLSLKEAVLAPEGRDLWAVFAAGLVATGALVGLTIAGLRRWILHPPGQRRDSPHWQDGGRTTAGLGQWLTAEGTNVAGSQRIDGELRRCATRWASAGQASVHHLRELKQGAHTTREIGRRILESAEQLKGTVEGFRKHLNGISNSTSDNSTSLMQMSASIDEVAGSADQLSHYVVSTAASVEQMVGAIGEVADRVEALAGETGTTATSMGHIESSTREIEVNAREASILGGRMAEAARDGYRAVVETLQGIHSSYGVIQETARAMDELQESSLAIGGVVKIINEINDKTKLLALNAAIIAAQAGEHGKSFAVVAHEIKNLSDRTASSTGEISRLVRGIRERMAAAAEAVARGEGATGSSVELAERAGEALRHIRDTAQVSHDMTREILRATEEQSRGSQEVMSAMQEVNAMVAYTRNATGRHRSSGEEVTAQIGTMRDLTEQVKLATAEQAEVSRYISDAIAAVDRNLQTMVDAVDRRREDTDRIVEHAADLRERGEAEALEVRAAEEALTAAAEELNGLIAALGPTGEAGGRSGS